MHLLLALLVSAQEADLYSKCDSEIPWISDGTILIDCEQLGNRPKNYRVDRAALLAKAKEKAAAEGKPILWYCPRIPGGHMNRAQVLDQYMKVAVFTDPDVVALVTKCFVPLRMCCDDAIGKELGIKRFDFVEPGFIVLTEKGEVVHKIDRIRTFNAAWVRDALAPFAKDPPKPRAKSKGFTLLSQGKFAEAKAELEKEGGPEALYYLAFLDADRESRWREIVKKHPDTRWAWRAASNLVVGIDTLRDGPMAHHFEDFTAVVVDGKPTSTRAPATDARVAVERAVRFLLRTQSPRGSWNDSRYVYCPDPQILPNVIVAVTALAALALLEWREVDPRPIDDAVARAEKFLTDEANVNRGKNEDCYADAYRLLYFAKKKDAKRMNAIVEKIASRQTRSGLWAHEYPNPFATAAVVHGLAVAKAAGADVPDAMMKRAAEALAKPRGDGGRQPYATGRASSEKNSMARTAMCELALFECGAGTIEDVGKGVESYFRHLASLEAVRVCDFHADQELGGFFYFHGVFHTTEAAVAVKDPKHLKRLREQVLALPEIDGSFVDSHELGKGYGTAMALLILRRTE